MTRLTVPTHIWIGLFGTTKICIGPLTTEIFKLVKLYVLPRVYDEWKTGRGEERERERLGRKGGIVFQAGADIHNEREEKVYDATKKLPIDSHRYGRTAQLNFENPH